MTCSCASMTAEGSRRSFMQSLDEIGSPEEEIGRPKEAQSAPVLERPFYFIIVLWGARFRDYFLDLCLPTLLSPRNLPSLATRQRSKFLFCTRPADWAAIPASALF